MRRQPLRQQGQLPSMSRWAMPWMPYGLRQSPADCAAEVGEIGGTQE